MNVENLENYILEHEFIKNYKTMCEILEEEIKGRGNSRNAQFKEWRRYFHWENQGHKFIILEIYDKPLAKVDNRGKSEGSRNNYKGIYAELVDTLLLQYLIKQRNIKGCTIDTTNNKLAYATGIINHNYRKAFSNQNKFFNKIKMDSGLNQNRYAMYDTFNNIKSKIRELIKGSLDRLQRNNKLTYEYDYFITEDTENRQATKEELELIKDIEIEVMEELQKDKKQIDNNYQLLEKFRLKVLKKVQKQYADITFIYMSYIISFTERIEPLEDDEINKLKQQLNELILKYLNKKPMEMQEKTRKQYKEKNYFGLGRPRIDKYMEDRLDKNYINYCISFVDILCNLQAINITNLIR